MHLRKAKKNDLDSVYKLIYSATRRGKILKRTQDDLRNILHCFWVAEQEGVIYACCALEIYNKKLAEIRSLVVDPVKEKKGIASALVDHCIKEAKEKGIYEVLVITNRENLFRRHGFSEQLHDQKALFLRP